MAPNWSRGSMADKFIPPPIAEPTGRPRRAAGIGRQLLPRPMALNSLQASMADNFIPPPTPERTGRRGKAAGIGRQLPPRSMAPNWWPWLILVADRFTPPRILAGPG